jgi:hypothetical protein
MVRGIHYHKRDRRWNVNLKINGKRTYIGCFTNKYGAIHLYVLKKRELGEERDIKEIPQKEYERYLKWLKMNPEKIKILEDKLKKE